LVGELQPSHAGGGDDVGRVLEGHADEADLGAVDVLDRVGGQDRVPAGLLYDVRGEDVEARTGEGAGRAGVLVVLAVAVVDAAAVGEALDLPVTLVELVVADGGDVE